jgi:hypothetical protein
MAESDPTGAPTGIPILQVGYDSGHLVVWWNDRYGLPGAATLVRKVVAKLLRDAIDRTEQPRPTYVGTTVPVAPGLHAIERGQAL